MSDKWIKVGPGCEIDPERMAPILRTGIEERLLQALQQREERRKKVFDECLKHIITGPTMESMKGELVDEALDWFARKIISIMEGTDGE